VRERLQTKLDTLLDEAARDWLRQRGIEAQSEDRPTKAFHYSLAAAIGSTRGVPLSRILKIPLRFRSDDALIVPSTIVGVGSRHSMFKPTQIGFPSW
jgi:hypothetical protein